MRLSELVAGLADDRPSSDPDITGLSIDSRLVGPGMAFVAIRGGQEQDRHPFIGQAVGAGASAVVMEDAVDTGGVPAVRVASARRALAEMAVRIYGAPARAMRMVGVTGTSGKTTTTTLVRSILEAGGLRPGMVGTVEYRIGHSSRPSQNSTPEAHVLQGLLREMADGGCRSAVMEATSHGLVLDRLRGIAFEAAVFTNLSRDHLDFHPSLDAYRAAKATLFENLDAAAHAVLNVDDPSWRAMAAPCRAKVLTYGLAREAGVRIAAGETDYRGTQMTLVTPWGTLAVALALTGRFNMHNAAAAAATGLAMGVDPRTVGEAMRDVRVPGRFEPVTAGQPFGVFVDYAHKPDALENVLRAARPLARGRVISVFGCGGDRDRGKRPEMGRISAAMADLTVVTSDNPRTEDPAAIVSEIVPGVGGAPHVVEVDRRRAIGRALREAREGDVVVIAGKGHEVYQIVGREKRHFDDREEALAALKDLGYGR